MKTSAKKYQSAHEFWSASPEERAVVWNAMIDGAIEDQLETMRKADEMIAAREKAKANGSNGKAHTNGAAKANGASKSNGKTRTN